MRTPAGDLESGTYRGLVHGGAGLTGPAADSFHMLVVDVFNRRIEAVFNGPRADRLVEAEGLPRLHDRAADQLEASPYIVVPVVGGVFVDRCGGGGPQRVVLLQLRHCLLRPDHFRHQLDRSAGHGADHLVQLRFQRSGIQVQAGHFLAEDKGIRARHVKGKDLRVLRLHVNLLFQACQQAVDLAGIAARSRCIGCIGSFLQRLHLPVALFLGPIVPLFPGFVHQGIQLVLVHVHVQQG